MKCRSHIASYSIFTVVHFYNDKYHIIDCSNLYFDTRICNDKKNCYYLLRCVIYTVRDNTFLVLR